MLPDARREYADALVDTLELIAPASAAARGWAFPAAATGLGRIGHLRRRLTMILTETGSKSLSLNP